MWTALLRLALVALCGAVAWPSAPARAHEPAVLESATPGPNATLATLPPRLQLLFDAELAGEGSSLRVIGPNGQRADRRDLQVDGVRLLVSLRDQGPGLYRVRWRAATDEDGHPSSGEYNFVIQPNLPPSAPRVSVVPTRAANGQGVSLTGSGFTPNGTVVLTVGDGEELLGLATTDATGRFSANLALPATLPYGRQVVQAADAADHLATCALWVPEPGGVGVVAVRMSGEPTEGQIDYSLRVENRSGFRLSNVVVRAQVPPGTAVLFEGLEQPEGASHPEIVGDEIVWRLRSLPPHAIRGPFAFTVTTARLSGRPTLNSVATVDYTFTDSPRGARGQAQSEEVSVRVATR